MILANVLFFRHQLLAIDGNLILRDYALYDEVQLRFHQDPSQAYSQIPALLSPSTSSPSPPSNTSVSIQVMDDTENNNNKAWYKRGDLTMTYFFTMEEIQNHILKACEGTNFVLEGEMVVVKCLVENRKEGKEMERRFVQGSWKKTLR